MQARFNKQRFITTRNLLYLERMRELVVITLSFIFIVVMLLGLLIFEELLELYIFEDGANIFGGIVFLGVIFLFIIRGIVLPKRAFIGIDNLREQEKVLGFEFDEEMKKSKIHSTCYQDNTWFINTQYTLLVFHRQYILNVGDIIRNKYHSPRSPRETAWVTTVTTIDDEKELKIYGDKHILLELKKWSELRNDEFIKMISL